MQNGRYIFPAFEMMPSFDWLDNFVILLFARHVSFVIEQEKSQFVEQ